MDLPSTEKHLGHCFQVCENNFVECKRCRLVCPCKEYPTMNAIISSGPCRPTSKESPTKRQLDFSPEWVDNLKSVVADKPGTCWEATTSQGKTFQVWGDGDDMGCIPKPQEFPLSLEPMSEEAMLTRELEGLHLEEELLQEQLALLELEEQQRSFLNSTVPASSGMAPAKCDSVKGCLFNKIASTIPIVV